MVEGVGDGLGVGREDGNGVGTIVGLGEGMTLGGKAGSKDGTSVPLINNNAPVQHKIIGMEMQTIIFVANN